MPETYEGVKAIVVKKDPVTKILWVEMVDKNDLLIDTVDVNILRTYEPALVIVNDKVVDLTFYKPVTCTLHRRKGITEMECFTTSG